MKIAIYPGSFDPIPDVEANREKYLKPLPSRGSCGVLGDSWRVLGLQSDAFGGPRGALGAPKGSFGRMGNVIRATEQRLNR